MNESASFSRETLRLRTEELTAAKLEGVLRDGMSYVDQLIRERTGLPLHCTIFIWPPGGNGDMAVCASNSSEEEREQLAEAMLAWLERKGFIEGR